MSSSIHHDTNPENSDNNSDTELITISENELVHKDTQESEVNAHENGEPQEQKKSWKEDREERKSVKAQKKAERATKWSFLVGIIVGVVIGVIGLSLYKCIGPVSEPAPVVQEVRTLNVETVKEIVKPASSLISTTYQYTDVDVYRDSKQVLNADVPLTENMCIYTYSGSIQLGIESLNDIEYVIDNENTTISATLPEIVVIGNIINPDSFNAVFEHYSALNQLTFGDVKKTDAELKQIHAEQVLNDPEIMEKAKTNLQVVIASFLTAADETQEYEVIFM